MTIAAAITPSGTATQTETVRAATSAQVTSGRQLVRLVGSHGNRPVCPPDEEVGVDADPRGLEDRFALVVEHAQRAVGVDLARLRIDPPDVAIHVQRGVDVPVVGGIHAVGPARILLDKLRRSTRQAIRSQRVAPKLVVADRGAGVDRELGVIKEVTATDAAVMLNYSSKVVIVPGYGLAVAQAQHICSEMDELLEANGVEVKYAIHPVAGRMPGHMNVLLAEVDISYDKLLDLDDSNSNISDTDVVLVVGANDVVNPLARAMVW